MVDSDDSAPGADLDSALERRRPGRNDSASPELIPLLRHPAAVAEHAAFLLPERILKHRLLAEHEDADDLRAARGVMAALAISLGFWVLCFLAMGLLTRNWGATPP